jgi:hypothetical protein
MPLLSACGGTVGTSSSSAAKVQAVKPGTITIMSPTGEITDAFVKGFEAAYPQLKVTQINTDATRLNAMLAAGNPPDLVRDGEGFLMAYKDERGVNDPSTSHKHILLTSFDRPGGPYQAPRGPVGPSAVEGPCFFRRGDEWILMLDHYLEGRYGAYRSSDGLTWKQAEITLPPGIRHASVLAL